MATPNRTCSVDGCDLEHHGLNLCKKHYQQHRRTEDAGRSCYVDGCEAPQYAIGLCNVHYAKNRIVGMPECSAPGCTRPQLAKGLCGGHYAQRSRGRKLTPLHPHNREVGGYKVCTHCNENLPITEFGKKLNRYTEMCKPCRGIMLRADTYGLTRDAVRELITQPCESCGVVLTDTKLVHIDHDHVTGKVRGVLCHPCNTSLGLLGEDPDRLRALAAYIERHR